MKAPNLEFLPPEIVEKVVILSSATFKGLEAQINVALAEGLHLIHPILATEEAVYTVMAAKPLYSWNRIGVSGVSAHDLAARGNSIL